jgi:hypothetical protein
MMFRLSDKTTEPSLQSAMVTVLGRLHALSEREDDGVLDPLMAAAPGSGSQLRPLLARCLVATGRHMELHRLLIAGEHPGICAEALPEGGR